MQSTKDGISQMPKKLYSEKPSLIKTGLYMLNTELWMISS